MYTGDCIIELTLKLFFNCNIANRKQPTVKISLFFSLHCMFLYCIFYFIFMTNIAFDMLCISVNSEYNFGV